MELYQFLQQGRDVLEMIVKGIPVDPAGLYNVLHGDFPKGTLLQQAEEGQIMAWLNDGMRYDLGKQFRRLCQLGEGMTERMLKRAKEANL